jgi:hypothetical protein
MKEKITDDDLDLILGKKVSNSSANFDAKVKQITIKQPERQSNIIDFNNWKQSLALIAAVICGMIGIATFFTSQSSIPKDDFIASYVHELELEDEFIELETTANEYAFAFEPETTEAIYAFIEYNEI